MAFPFPYTLNYNGSWKPLPVYKPSSFDSVCVFGFPSTFRLEDIRNLFCQKEGLCSCAYAAGYPQCVVIRFNVPSVAESVLNRYHNAIIAGYKLLVYPANTGLFDIAHNLSFLNHMPQASNNEPTKKAHSTSPINGSEVQDTKKTTELMNSYVGSTLWQQQGAYYANLAGRRNVTLPENPRTDGDGKRRSCVRRKERKNARKKRMYAQSKDESMKRKRKRRDRRRSKAVRSNTSKKTSQVYSNDDADFSNQPSKAKKQAIDKTKYPVSGHQFSLKDKLLEKTHNLPRKSDRAIPVSEITIKKEDTVTTTTSCDRTSDVVFPKKSPRTPELKSSEEKDVFDEAKIENVEENENLDSTFLSEYLSLKNEVLLNINSLSCVGDLSLELPLSEEPSMAKTSEKNGTFVENKLECTVGSEMKDDPFLRAECEMKDDPFLTAECENDVEDTLWNSALMGCSSTLVQKSSEQECSSELVLEKPSVDINLGIKELQEILDKVKEIGVKILEKSCESSVEVHEKSSTVEHKPEIKTAAPTPGEGKKKKTKKSPNNSKKKSRKRDSRQDSTKGVAAQGRETREQNKEKFLKIFEFKKREVELEYERDCSTLLDVVKTLASKDPSLRENLQKVVRQCLIELGDQLAEKLEAELESVLDV